MIVEQLRHQRRERERIALGRAEHRTAMGAPPGDRRRASLGRAPVGERGLPLDAPARETVRPAHGGTPFLVRLGQHLEAQPERIGVDARRAPARAAVLLALQQREQFGAIGCDGERAHGSISVGRGSPPSTRLNRSLSRSLLPKLLPLPMPVPVLLPLPVVSPHLAAGSRHRIDRCNPMSAISLTSSKSCMSAAVMPKPWGRMWTSSSSSPWTFPNHRYATTMSPPWKQAPMGERVVLHSSQYRRSRQPSFCVTSPMVIAS